jgi:hypothetical protein
MSISTVDAVEFELSPDYESIRLAGERIRRGNAQAEAILRGRSAEDWPGPERRRERRTQLVLGAFLLPVEVCGERARPLSVEQRQLPVLTRDLSPHGIAFQHDRPLPGRHAILEFALWNEGIVELLVERRWSQSDEGTAFCHRSGCRILAVARRTDSDRHWRPAHSPACGR